MDLDCIEIYSSDSTNYQDHEEIYQLIYISRYDGIIVMACHNVPYTTVTRQLTVDFGNIGRFSVHLPLTKDTGENLDYRLHFSQLSYRKEKFSTISYISRLSITILNYRLHLARL